jgi:predicted RNase H-like nuclease (RuvC/YqgF family)
MSGKIEKGYQEIADRYAGGPNRSIRPLKGKSSKPVIKSVLIKEVAQLKNKVAELEEKVPKLEEGIIELQEEVDALKECNVVLQAQKDALEQSLFLSSAFPYMQENSALVKRLQESTIEIDRQKKEIDRLLNKPLETGQNTQSIRKRKVSKRREQELQEEDQITETVPQQEVSELEQPHQSTSTITTYYSSSFPSLWSLSATVLGQEGDSAVVESDNISLPK